jgi:predicted DNA-binding transcriptional regulator AlpA
VPRNPRTVLVRDIVSVNEILRLAGGVPRSTLKLWRDKHAFPQPIRTVGRRTELWDAEEVRTWLEARKASKERS